MIVKCTCKNGTCQIELQNEDGYRLMITDKKGDNHLMYLDANEAMNLIRMGKEMLNEQMGALIKQGDEAE